MSDDIVKRLRNKRAWDLGNLDEMSEAADEIERLTAELTTERIDLQRWQDANSKLMAERDALRALLRDLRDVVDAPELGRIDHALKGDGED